MTQVHTLLSQLERCRSALRDGDEITGIEALQKAVEISPGNIALEENLSLLTEDGNSDVVLAWLEESLSLLRGEESVGDDSGVSQKGFDLFEDFGLNDFDLSVPSSAFASEATRQVEPSLAREEEGKTQVSESLGQRLKMSTGKFKIPPPSAKAKPSDDLELAALDSPFEDPFDDVQIEEGRNLTPIRGVPAIGDVDSDPQPGGLQFGFRQQEQKTGSQSDEFDFDLGLSSPQPAMASGVPQNELTRPNQLQPSRSLQPTPAARRRDVVDEDDFFALAESLASESSAPREDRPYRGEPLGKSSASKTKQVSDHSRNPFSQNEPTGVGKGPLEPSYALEEMSRSASSSVVSGGQTNLTAILLEARRMYERGEFEAALDICGKVLSRGVNTEAEELKGAIEGEIERVCVAQIGSLTQVPELNMAADITSLGFDHRAGFLMSQIDGMMSLEDILELASMPRFESLQLLVEFLEKEVIKLS